MRNLDFVIDSGLTRQPVSRRHARLIISADGVLLEDFGSKNGTFRDGERVGSPIRFADRDHIRIGSVLIAFRTRPASDTTETQAGTAPEPGLR